MDKTVGALYLDSFIDSIPGNVFAVDTDYKYLYFNSNYSNLLYATHGIKVEPGMYSLDNIETEEERKKAKLAIDRALTGEHFTITTSFQTETGERLFYEIKYYPLYRNGTIYGVTVVAVNVHLDNDTPLGDSLLEQRLQSFGETFPDFFVITDHDGNMKFANKSFHSFFKTTNKQLRKKNFTDLLNEKQRKDYLEKLSSLTYDNPYITIVCRLQNPLGAQQWTIWTETGVFDNDKSLIELISIGKNISDIVNAAMEKDSYIQLLEDAIFRTSHQVRQPISHILGVAHLIQSEKITVDEFRKMISYCQVAAKELDGYMHDLNELMVVAFKEHKDAMENDDLIEQVNRVAKMEFESAGIIARNEQTS